MTCSMCIKLAQQLHSNIINEMIPTKTSANWKATRLPFVKTQTCQDQTSDLSLNLPAQENISQLGQHQKLDASLAQVYIIENSGAKFENGTDLGQPVLTFHTLPDHKCRQVWKIRKRPLVWTIDSL